MRTNITPENIEQAAAALTRNMRDMNKEMERIYVAMANFYEPVDKFSEEDRQILTRLRIILKNHEPITKP